MTPIIIAASMHDADEYARERGWRQYIVVTPRSIWAVRGRSGPVYATPAGTDHPDFDNMREQAAPCALGVDQDRVA